ncbi:hypothetical protein ACFPM0_01115 [Pseudonocardia sulfidoxydans]|uniref:hypothetical protein n=1 Tax=Pseudonocardia sulfidoxydans TaxID=54011 RepID=UPI0036230B3D
MHAAIAGSDAAATLSATSASVPCAASPSPRRATGAAPIRSASSDYGHRLTVAGGTDDRPVHDVTRRGRVRGRRGRC